MKKIIYPVFCLSFLCMCLNAIFSSFTYANPEKQIHGPVMEEPSREELKHLQATTDAPAFYFSFKQWYEKTYHMNLFFRSEDSRSRIGIFKEQSPGYQHIIFTKRPDASWTLTLDEKAYALSSQAPEAGVLVATEGTSQNPVYIIYRVDQGLTVIPTTQWEATEKQRHQEWIAQQSSPDSKQKQSVPSPQQKKYSKTDVSKKTQRPSSRMTDDETAFDWLTFYIDTHQKKLSLKDNLYTKSSTHEIRLSFHGEGNEDIQTQLVSIQEQGNKWLLTIDTSEYLLDPEQAENILFAGDFPAQRRQDNTSVRLTYSHEKGLYEIRPAHQDDRVVEKEPQRTTSPAQEPPTSSTPCTTCSRWSTFWNGIASFFAWIWRGVTFQWV